MEVNPLSIILVKSDSKGDRLLFRYPYETDSANNINDQKNGRRNPYALNITEDLLQTPTPQTSNIHKGQLTGFTDEVLSTLFAVKPDFRDQKFELKVNDVRFVGHPIYITQQDEGASQILINIAFALQALASHSVVKCYHDLCIRLGKALQYEEKRCTFLTDEMKIMIHDESSSSDNEDNLDSSETSTSDGLSKSPFHNILQKSSLANSLKMVFEDLTSTGIVQVRINDWTLVSFCLPHKAHQFHNRGLIIEPETIDKCLRSLRPYHGLLLLVDPNELLDSIPFDSSPSLIRLIMLYSPLKSLQTLAIEADLPLQQVFQLTGHLVYWAKATIIYPLCESNVYVIAPDAQIYLHSPLVEKFAEDFPGLCLIQVISMLSLPAPLWYPARTWAGGAALFARCVVWMLQRHLLLQLHTYIQFLPTVNGPPVNCSKDYHCGKHDDRKQALSDSSNSLNHMPHTTVTTPSSENSGENSLILCGHDNNEWMFPTISHNSNKKCDKASNRVNGKINRTDKIKIDNTKSTSRETIEDTALGSSIDSQLSPSNISCASMEIIKYNNNENEKNVIPKNSANKIFDTSKSATDINKMETVNNKKNEFLNINLELKNISNAYSECDSKNSINTIENDVLIIKNSENGTNSKNSSNTCDKEKYLTSNNSNSSSGSNLSEKKININPKHLDVMSPQSKTVNSSYDVVDGLNKNSSASIDNSNGEPLNEESILSDFTDEEKTALLKIPAARNPEDLHLMAMLYKKGYFRGEQHLEEIMFMENLTRSQVLQLLDKFRDVLITYETEDPAIAMLYSNL